MLKDIIKNRNINFLCMGHIVSHAGDAVFAIALPWLLLDMTGSKVQTAMIAISAYIPSLIFGFFAGVIVDKYDLKRIMIFSDLFRFLLVCIIPISLMFNFSSPLLIGFVTFFISSFSVLFYPARDSMIPEIINSDELPLANSMVAISGQFSHFLGPLLAGLGLSIIGIMHLFTIDALSFLFSALMISFVFYQNNFQKSNKSQSQINSLIESFHYLKVESGMMVLLLITVLNNICIMGPAILGLTVFVKEVLMEDFAILAYLETSMACGMIVGSIIFWFVNKYIKLINLLIIGIIIDGLTFCLLYIAQEKFIAMLILFIHGIGIPLIMVSRTTIIQRVVPDKLRGRVFSMFHMSVIGTTAISIALTGIILEYIGAHKLFLLIGFCGALCSLLVFIPNLNRFEEKVN